MNSVQNSCQDKTPLQRYASASSTASLLQCLQNSIHTIRNIHKTEVTNITRPGEMTQLLEAFDILPKHPRLLPGTHIKQFIFHIFDVSILMDMREELSDCGFDCISLITNYVHIFCT